jgi:diphthamide biosynthesis protein 2
MRRYAAVQKARDADVFAILVGTLGVGPSFPNIPLIRSSLTSPQLVSYLPVIKHLRSLLTSKDKKSYTISVGKLNPAKLANFLEIQCFVLVACPENTLIEAKVRLFSAFHLRKKAKLPSGSQDFLRPIVTPYELEIALQPEPTWSGTYILNFDQLLTLKPDESNDTTPTNHPNTTSSDQDQDQPTSPDPDQPIFSLITGTYRHPKRYTDPKATTTTTTTTVGSPQSNSALVLRNQSNTIARITDDSAALQFLQERTYRGLEPRVDEDGPSILEQGRSGIARGYQDDLKHTEC